MSHVTRHTSHVTRHTSHVTRHTSHMLVCGCVKRRAGGEVGRGGQGGGGGRGGLICTDMCAHSTREATANPARPTPAAVWEKAGGGGRNARTGPKLYNNSSF